MQFKDRPFSKVLTWFCVITKILLILFLFFPKLFVKIREKKLTKSDFSDSSNILVPPSTYPLDLKIHKNIITIRDMETKETTVYTDEVYLSRESFAGSKRPRGIIIKVDDLQMWNSNIRFYSLVGDEEYEWFT